MKITMELSAKAALCRQLAAREPGNRAIWLAEAQRWSHLAEDEISAHLVACNCVQPPGEMASTTSSSDTNPEAR